MRFKICDHVSPLAILSNNVSMCVCVNVLEYLIIYIHYRQTCSWSQFIQSAKVILLQSDNFFFIVLIFYFSKYAHSHVHKNIFYQYLDINEIVGLYLKYYLIKLLMFEQGYLLLFIYIIKEKYQSFIIFNTKIKQNFL